MPLPRQLQLLRDSMDHAELIVNPGATYGEVFTRRWVVDLILDLVGYTPDSDLGSQVLVEPSCGAGSFLVAASSDWSSRARVHGRDLGSLTAIRAFDLLRTNAALARKAVADVLPEHGLSGAAADTLVDAWVTTDDFLLSDHGLLSEHGDEGADYVVGNPPYIRLENLPPDVRDAYRQACPTMRGRGDMYVGFIERGLSLLRADGALAFICADRWMAQPVRGRPPTS